MLVDHFVSVFDRMP